MSVSSLQAGPLDLMTDDFYSKRTEMIEARLKWIKSASSKVTYYPSFYAMYCTVCVTYVLQELATVVGGCWEENKGRVCYGADWDILPSIEDAKVHSITYSIGIHITHPMMSCMCISSLCVVNVISQCRPWLCAWEVNC